MNPSAHALDHVVEQGPTQAMQGPALGVFALAGHDHAGAVDPGGGPAGQFPIQLPWAFDVDPLALHSTFTLAGIGDGLFSNA